MLVQQTSPSAVNNIWKIILWILRFHFENWDYINHDSFDSNCDYYWWLLHCIIAHLLPSWCYISRYHMPGLSRVHHSRHILFNRNHCSVNSFDEIADHKIRRRTNDIYPIIMVYVALYYTIPVLYIVVIEPIR
jgi:hypothetical protein